MSEEEIIKVLQEIIQKNQQVIKEAYKNKDINTMQLVADIDNEAIAIEGLLDLYNKEKEKNKELLEGLKYRVNYCKLLEKELYGNGINYNMELTKIEEKYLQELLEERN